MREIKFRAYDTANKTMYSESNLCVKFEQRNYSVIGDKIPRPHKNIILMQFTGLKDKNGVEIYEGDIVKAKLLSEYHADKVVFFRVVWEEAGFTLDWINPWNSDYIPPLFSDCEVTGNIYENPDLMNK